jgi:hypothetical protein
VERALRFIRRGSAAAVSPDQAPTYGKHRQKAYHMGRLQRPERCDEKAAALDFLSTTRKSGLLDRNARIPGGQERNNFKLYRDMHWTPGAKLNTDNVGSFQGI